MATEAHTQTPVAGAVPYLGLFALQTIGALIVLVNGVPIYRQLASDFANHRPQPEIIWWAVAAVVLIQLGYWLQVRWRLAPPPGGHIVIGHVAGFIARLSFILASSTFSVMFLVRFDELNLPWYRCLLLLVVMFSMYCWTLELERLARSLHGTPTT